MELTNLFIKSVFVENMALAFFLGMCSFLSCSKKVDTAIGLGFAVVIVQGLTVPMNNLIHTFLLKEGALAWIHPSFAATNFEFLGLISYIGTIAAIVQVLEMALDKYAPALYVTLGVFLPLITVNCVILAGSLFMVERDYNFAESVVYGLGSGVGWAIAIVALAACREKMRYSNVPPGLRGLGMSFMLAGLMAIGFLSFSGIQL
ncbi:MAG: Na(+)-translocating NADH-quinone reductase subunit E [Candidatus Hydrogenedentota bacterium]